MEAQPVKRLTAERVADFLWKDFICRHGCFGRLVIDGGAENKGVVKALLDKYGIKRVLTSAYHPQANAMVERGDRPIVDALAKMGEGRGEDWVTHLPAVLWADRSTTNTTPYHMVCGQDPVLPIELEFPTWRILPWERVHTTADLLALRARQLERRDEDLEEAILRLQRVRTEGKEYFDQKHRLREKDLGKGDLVLLHDTGRFKSREVTNKLGYKWLGPYHISEANSLKGTYILSELDGTLLSGTVAGNRLKKFFPRSERESRPEPEDENEHQEESPPTLPMLMEEDDNSSALSSLGEQEEEEVNLEEEEDIEGEEGFRVHEGTRYRAQRRQ